SGHRDSGVEFDYAARLLKDPNEDFDSVRLMSPIELRRALHIRDLADQGVMAADIASQLVKQAATENSQTVRRSLASAIQSLPFEITWQVGAARAQHAEDTEDRNLPHRLWHGLAPPVSKDIARAFALAQHT